MRNLTPAEQRELWDEERRHWWADFWEMERFERLYGEELYSCDDDEEPEQTVQDVKLFDDVIKQYPEKDW